MSNTEKFIYKKGIPLPLGTTLIDNRVNFSVSVPNANECTLKIYQVGESHVYESIILNKDFRTGNVFSVQIEKFEYEKYEYNYEVLNKEFVDPYARIITGRSKWGKPVSKRREKFVRGGFYFDCFDWTGDKKPDLSYSDSIIYKTHVRSFTCCNNSKVSKKGTFAGIEEKIGYLKNLGITTLFLMPVYDFNEILIDKYHVGPENPTYMEYNALMAKQKEVTKDPVAEHFVRLRVLEGVIPYKINYWGYSEECSYFAPKSSYAFDITNPGYELKHLIKKLHKEDMEIILEFNFEYWVNKQLIIDCLRYWVLEYHIDGFRVNNNVVPVETIANDPILADIKLLSDGWNLNSIYKEEFIPDKKNLAEYNDGFMADVRKYIKGDEGQVGNFAYRIRRNSVKNAIINYISNNNGFTLYDLFSYDIKHNEDNGEANRDGTEFNFSWNCGFEGPTRKKKVMMLRKKMIKNTLVTLFFSQGTPMLLGGDEVCNTQYGNNNAYCQDNQTSWINWNTNAFSKEIFEFTKKLIEIRKNHPILRMNDEFKVRDYISCGYPDLSYHGTKAWFPDFSNYSRTIGILLCGEYSVAGKKEQGKKKVKYDKDNYFYIAYNMHWEPHEFDLPKLPIDLEWEVIIDTHTEKGYIGSIKDNNSYSVRERTVAVFTSKKSEKNIINVKREKSVIQSIQALKDEDSNNKLNIKQKIDKGNDIQEKR